MLQPNINEASAYFNANWQRYQLSVKRNTLYHVEMFSTLSAFLNQHFANRNFTLADFGCGDSASIAPALANSHIEKYIGVDEAMDVLKLSAINLENIHCEKEYFSQDMLKALSSLHSPVDIIFSSYAIHHLSSEQKKEFIRQCKQKLKDDGFLIMVDGVLAKNQSRDEWLNALKERFQIAIPELTPDELDERMEHPRANDFPEPLSAFESMGKDQGWKSFQVLVDKNIFAFMVFFK